MKTQNVIAGISILFLVFVILGSCIKGDSSEIKKSLFEGNSNQNTPRDSIVKGLVLDTIILLEPYKVCLYENQNEWPWYYGIYDTMNNLLSDDSLVEAFGYYFNNIILTDFNFDGIPDLDIASHPATRSGANEFHELWLAQDDGTLQKYQNNPLSYCWVDHQNMEIYNVYNGPDSPYFSKFKWVGDSLTETETIHIDGNYKDEPNSIKVTHSIRKGKRTVVVSEKLYNTKDEIPIPEGYFNVTYIQW